MSLHTLVLGATGTQGRAVTTALLARGHRVTALVRDPHASSAQRLAAHGVQLVRGDFDHPDTVEEAARGVDRVFVNTSPFVPGVGLDGEVRQGRGIVDALARAGVPHVVYSSVSDAHRHTGVGHFDSKWAVEQHLAASGLSYTITGPVFFAENLLMPWTLPALAEGTLRLALPAGRVLHVVTVGDIGRFNAVVLERGPELAGRRLDYASDALTPTEMARHLSEAWGRPVAFAPQPLAELDGLGSDMVAMFRWFDEVGYSADPDALRAEFPDVGWQRFETWAAEQSWSTLLDGAA